MSGLSSLRKSAQKRAETTAPGFKFAPTPHIKLSREAGELIKEVKKIDGDTEYVPAAEYSEGVTLEGEPKGGGFRLSAPAFEDLCKIARTPHDFIQRLGIEDEDLALRVMRHSLDAAHLKGYSMQVHNGVVMSVRGNETMALALERVTHTALVAVGKGAVIDEAALSGRDFKLSLTTRKIPVGPPARKDVVGFGANLAYSFGRDTVIDISQYQNRLACLNGSITAESLGRLKMMDVGKDYADLALMMRTADEGSEDILLAMNQSYDMPLPWHDEKKMGAVFTGMGQFVGAGLITELHEADEIGAEARTNESDIPSVWDAFNTVTRHARDVTDVRKRQALQANATGMLRWLVDKGQKGYTF